MCASGIGTSCGDSKKVRERRRQTHLPSVARRYLSNGSTSRWASGQRRSPTQSGLRKLVASSGDTRVNRADVTAWALTLESNLQRIRRSAVWKTVKPLWKILNRSPEVESGRIDTDLLFEDRGAYRVDHWRRRNGHLRMVLLADWPRARRNQSESWHERPDLPGTGIQRPDVFGSHRQMPLARNCGFEDDHDSSAAGERHVKSRKHCSGRRMADLFSTRTSKITAPLRRERSTTRDEADLKSTRVRFLISRWRRWTTCDFSIPAPFSVACRALPRAASPARAPQCLQRGAWRGGYLAIQIANHSANRAFAATIDVVAGKAELVVTGSVAGLPETVFPVVAPAWSLRRYAACAGIVTLPDLPGEYLLVLGIDVFTNSPFRTFELTDFKAGEFDVQRWLGEPEAIAVSEEFARIHHLQAGDVLRVQVNGVDRSLHVGFILRTSDASALDPHFAAMDIGWAQEFFGRRGALSSIQLQLTQPRDRDAVSASLRCRSPAGCSSRDSSAARRASAENARRLRNQSHRDEPGLVARRYVPDLQYGLGFGRAPAERDRNFAFVKYDQE